MSAGEDVIAGVLLLILSQLYSIELRMGGGGVDKTRLAVRAMGLLAATGGVALLVAGMLRLLQ